MRRRAAVLSRPGSRAIDHRGPSLTEIMNGDCLEIMPTLGANSVDAVVTDPPYGLSFMGKDWDHGIPGVEFWKAAYRVMKPGAFLLSFGGTRTFHRLTCAIEDAGLEIRDCLMWLYGSGFPKSHDVSKAIDKAAGKTRKSTYEPNFKNNDYGMGMGMGMGGGEWNAPSDPPVTDAAKQWSGWGTALKPAWEPIIVARKPLEGTVAENVLKWGTGGMNIDGSRIGTDAIKTQAKANGSSFTSIGEGQGFNGCLESFHVGRWPANLILDEEAGKMLDGQSGITQWASSTVRGSKRGQKFGMGRQEDVPAYGDRGGASRFFYCAKASKRERNAGLEGMPESPNMRVNAPRQNEEATYSSVMANNHPTVKPQALLDYLIRLVCPPNGLILDPFCGSGSTGVAAKNLGMRFIGIEKEAQYVEISKARLACGPVMAA